MWGCNIRLWQPSPMLVLHPEKTGWLQLLSKLCSAQESGFYHSGYLCCPNTHCFISSVSAGSPPNSTVSLCLALLSWEPGSAASSQAAFLHSEQWEVCLWKRLCLLRNAITIDQAETAMCALSLAFHASTVICRIRELCSAAQGALKIKWNWLKTRT